VASGKVFKIDGTQVVGTRQGAVSTAETDAATNAQQFNATVHAPENLENAADKADVQEIADKYDALVTKYNDCAGKYNDLATAFNDLKSKLSPSGHGLIAAS